MNDLNCMCVCHYRKISRSATCIIRLYFVLKTKDIYACCVSILLAGLGTDCGRRAQSAASCTTNQLEQKMAKKGIRGWVPVGRWIQQCVLDSISSTITNVSDHHHRTSTAISYIYLCYARSGRSAAVRLLLAFAIKAGRRAIDRRRRG